MRKKLLLTVLILSFTALKLTAQTHCKIVGQIIELKDKAVAAASVLLFNSKDSALIKSGITDKKGYYQFDGIKEGNYYIIASFTSYLDNNSSVFTVVADAHDIVAPTIVLKPAPVNMQEVTVEGRYTKPIIEVTPGKTVFNVENSINATGSNAFELLQKSPGVVTDKDNNIIIKGKNGVQIYIDGRPTQMSSQDLPAYLRSINSEDIESIEIISSPSAQYDASGNAGIINIKLKKNKRTGFNGSFSLGLNYGKSFKTPEAFSFSYRNKKFNFFSNYSIFWGNWQNNLFLYRQQSDSVYNQTNHDNTKGWVHNIKAGVDFFLTPKSTVGFIATVNLNNNTDITQGYTLIGPIGGIPIDSLSASNSIPGNVKNVDYNFNYRFSDSTGHQLGADIDYGFYRSNKISTQPNYFYNIMPDTFLYSNTYWNTTNTNINIYTAKLDYTTPFQKGKLEFGGKLSYVTTNNVYNFYNVFATPVFDSSQSNKFNYTENVNAVYVNYNRPLNKKWSVQGGLRVENTSSDGQLSALASISAPGDTVKRNYTDLFPSASVNYIVNTNNTFNLSFSRRIDRPNYTYLNPFEIKLDELTYQKGNAFLLPQYTNSIELTHTFKNKFNTTLSYSHVKDFNAQIIDTTDETRSYITRENLASQDILNINFSFPFTITKWWDIYTNLNAYYSSYKGTINAAQINLTVTSYSIYMQQTFKLGYNYTGEITGYYDGPSIWEGTFQSSPIGGMDIGLQKKLFHDKADIKLSCSDLFNTMHWRGISNYDGAYINASGNWESHLIKFNFTYHFGNSQIKQSVHETGSEEENKRTNSSQNLGGN